MRKRQGWFRLPINYFIPSETNPFLAFESVDTWNNLGINGSYPLRIITSIKKWEIKTIELPYLLIIARRCSYYRVINIIYSLFYEIIILLGLRN